MTKLIPVVFAGHVTDVQHLAEVQGAPFSVRLAMDALSVINNQLAITGKRMGALSRKPCDSSMASVRIEVKSLF